MESLCSVAMSVRVNSTPAASPACNSLCSASSQGSASRSALLSARPLQMRIPYNLLATPARSMKCIRASAVSSPEQVIDVEEKTQLKEKNTFSPNSYEVQSLLMEVCDETNIAEFELKIGEFKMHVKRDVTKLKGSAPSAVLVAPPIPSQPMEQSDARIVLPPTPKALAASSTSIVPNSASKSGSKIGLLEAAADEGLHFVTSPKVGIFRRSRVVKKKTGRPLCEEGQIVKEGQVVCYVEQLGTQQPVEADKSGEVMKIVCKDGEPVGYGDPLIAIRPSFAGIK